MTPVETFTAALESLARHKLRTALTMLGIVFGVGAVIAMLSIGTGGEQKALEAIGPGASACRMSSCRPRS